MINRVDLLKLKLDHRLKLVCCFAIFLFFFFLYWYPLVNHIKKYNHKRTLADSSPVVSYRITAGVTSNSSWRFSLPLSLLPANDSSHLINITGFKFLNNAACFDSLYIVCVLSAPGHQYVRRIIRKSYGAHIPTYFFVGNGTRDEQIQLDKESGEFHDIVQGNFNDSYRNLTLKHTMVFKWVVYQCPHIKYVLKCGDDDFINVVKMDSFLKSLSPDKTQNLLMCATIKYKDNCVRTSRDDFRVSFKDYSGFFYPPYCKRPVVLYSVDIIFKLYQLLQKEQKYFWMDDVFITGVEFANLNTTHAEFDSWVGYKKAFWIVKSRDDFLGFDPNEHLFVVKYSGNYLLKEMFQYLTYATFASFI